MDNKKTDDARGSSKPKIKREWPVSMEVRAALAAKGRAIRAAGHAARMRRINAVAKKKGKA